MAVSDVKQNPIENTIVKIHIPNSYCLRLICSEIAALGSFFSYKLKIPAFFYFLLNILYPQGGKKQHFDGDCSFVLLTVLFYPQCALHGSGTGFAIPWGC